MASGLTMALRKLQNDFIFQGATATAPATACFVALHTADPLDDGSAANELTATNGYARVSATFGVTNWSASTLPAADGQAIVSNAVAFTWTTSGGAFSGAAAFFSLRATSTVGNTTLANMYARGAVVPTQTTTATGQSITIPIGSAKFTLATS